MELDNDYDIPFEDCVTTTDSSLKRVHTLLPFRTGGLEPASPTYFPTKYHKPRRITTCPLAQKMVKTFLPYINRFNIGKMIGNNQPFHEYIPNEQDAPEEQEVAKKGLIYVNKSIDLVNSKLFNPTSTSRHFPVSICGPDLQDHLSEDETYYFTSTLHASELLINLDLDYHVREQGKGENDCPELLYELKYRFFKGILYHETSTHGAGIHGYFFCDISFCKSYKEKVIYVNKLKTLGRLLNKAYKGIYISSVELKGFPLYCKDEYWKLYNEIKYNNSPVIFDKNMINRGTLAKIPRFNQSEDINKRIEIFDTFMEKQHVVLTEEDINSYIDMLQKELEIKEETKAKDTRYIDFPVGRKINPDLTVKEETTTETTMYIDFPINRKINSDLKEEEKKEDKISTNYLGYKKDISLSSPPKTRVYYALRAFFRINGRVPNEDEFNILYENLHLNTGSCKQDRLDRYREAIEEFKINELNYEDAERYILNILSNITKDIIDIYKSKNSCRYAVTIDNIAFVYYAVMISKVPETPYEGIKQLHKSIYGKGDKRKETIQGKTIKTCFNILIDKGFVEMISDFIPPQKVDGKYIKGKGRAYRIKDK